VTAGWVPEVEVDAALAGALVAGQFPALAGAPVQPVGTGWDNTVWLVGDVLFRFPRRAVALDGLRRELLVLPRLSGLPLPVPVPTHRGAPALGYPWPWWGAAPVPGSELAGQPERARVAAATAVGGFLRALHDVPVDDALREGLPVDPMARSSPRDRAARTIGWLTELGRDQDPALRAVVDVDLGPSAAAPVLVHGDLHLRHLLVDEQVRATGVIDWGDTCLADPCVDLAVGWCAFSGEAREAFLAAYGRPVDADRESRARALAVSLCAALAAHAVAEGATARRDEALAGLSRAVG
jgi:aminoglycoside phosphotransferase (APT) family kinase protein